MCLCKQKLWTSIWFVLDFIKFFECFSLIDKNFLIGNDRQSIIRYFDRRKACLITSYTASSTNSSIYSLSCTPEFIFAAWDRGITVIDFS